jgi:glucose-6-phosphate isomerase
MTSRPLLTELSGYSELQAMAEKLKTASVEQLFAEDSKRATRFTLGAAGLHLDYSKHLMNPQTLASLLDLADKAGLQAEIAALFSGQHINNTEDRPALHTLLRASRSEDLKEKFKEVQAARGLMQLWSERINSGAWKGFTGAAITDVVNIGIGGSDLGPRLVTEALRPFHGNIACHYVANVDPADLQDCLLQLDPESTLFIVCSKSFRTEETLTNSLAARGWLLNAGALEAGLAKHFIAVTSNLQAADEFGIPAQNCLPMWDWVGGRYSVWSAIGISCAIAIGWERFTQFLAGAEAMDDHFRLSDPAENMPLLLGLLELWYSNFLGAGNHAVLPYDNSLLHLPAFLQQLTMESNGKRVSDGGTPLPYSTGTVLWGSAGTMGQHSFHQLLHQGTVLCPADFVLPLTTHTGMQEQHQQLVANCLAQSRTLMVGRSLEAARKALLERGLGELEAERLAPHLTMPGNRPNSVITMPSVNPGTLGALLALYEHRTFCSARLWGINPFDQWGVELGKEIGVEILGRMSGEGEGHEMDASTERLINEWQDAQDL